MKSIILFLSILIGISSCIVEVDLNPPHIVVGNLNEYETKEVIHEIWSGGVLIYEEAIYYTWLEIEFQNYGGLKADNIWAEVIFYDGNREIQTITIYIPDIRSGHSYTYTLDTGFESMYDYSDYEVNVYWE